MEKYEEELGEFRDKSFRSRLGSLGYYSAGPLSGAGSEIIGDLMKDFLGKDCILVEYNRNVNGLIGSIFLRLHFHRLFPNGRIADASGPAFPLSDVSDLIITPTDDELGKILWESSTIPSKVYELRKFSPPTNYVVCANNPLHAIVMVAQKPGVEKYELKSANENKVGTMFIF